MHAKSERSKFAFEIHTYTKRRSEREREGEVVRGREMETHGLSTQA